MLSESMQKLWDQFSDEEKAEINARYKMLHAEYVSLQELRKAGNVTQEDMAALLGIKQENVSRAERRSDMKLSTLRDYVEALGGHVQIQAVFPGDHVVNILQAQE